MPDEGEEEAMWVGQDLHKRKVESATLPEVLECHDSEPPSSRIATGLKMEHTHEHTFLVTREVFDISNSSFAKSKSMVFLPADVLDPSQFGNCNSINLKEANEQGRVVIPKNKQTKVVNSANIKQAKGVHSHNGESSSTQILFCSPSLSKDDQEGQGCTLARSVLGFSRDFGDDQSS
ncbi:uncharacterized protein MELLADRAFT_105361 [Melampsora larici-populina 98AG31]|uniref:Uncharacterized protein n=1 Tax=Melampsora larici-populina (strain 98AG31 / pathotype 3-4-7) TaxID=747676 RepID=F4RHV8_MELLP|nr:uncharacterized protein MELLADRAFT_105361 [Melampsora larici-populina 98AG31]EGG07892.1 hypothetical protein MELLADRAFT_105361 [Melampsora larici-populina 98AG31]